MMVFSTSQKRSSPIPTRKRNADTSSNDTVQPRDPLDTRENQLLAIARTLFARHGYDRTSLRDISEAASITKAALYYYFPNKDALFERVVLESLQSLYDEVSAEVKRADTPTERIRAFLRASANVLDHGRDRWIAGSNAFWQGAKDGQRLAALKLRDSYEKLLRQCIADGVASGEFRAVDAAMAGRFLLSALNHIPRWLKPDGKLSAAEVMEQFLDMLLYGLVLKAPMPAQPPATVAPKLRRMPAAV